MSGNGLTPRQRFDQHGYAVFPGVLDAEQVETIRKAIGDAMGDDWHLEQTFRLPEVAALLEHDPFVEPLRELMGENFVFVPEQTALGHYFGPWHRDTDQGEMAGHRFRFAPDFRQATAVIYMTDQHPEYAGGLSLVPHGVPQMPGSELAIETKAGDMLVFDTRLYHKATSPKVDPEAVPDEYRKSGVYFTVSANNAHAKAYRDFLASRGGTYSYITDGPDSYPPEATRAAEERGLVLMP